MTGFTGQFAGPLRSLRTEERTAGACGYVLKENLLAIREQLARLKEEFRTNPKPLRRRNTNENERIQNSRYNSIQSNHPDRTSIPPNENRTGRPTCID